MVHISRWWYYITFCARLQAVPRKKIIHCLFFIFIFRHRRKGNICFCRKQLDRQSAGHPERSRTFTEWGTRWKRKTQSGLRDLVTSFGGLSQECNIFFGKPPKFVWRSHRRAAPRILLVLHSENFRLRASLSAQDDIWSFCFFYRQKAGDQWSPLQCKKNVFPLFVFVDGKQIFHLYA